MDAVANKLGFENPSQLGRRLSKSMTVNPATGELQSFFLKNHPNIYLLEN